MSEKVFVPSPEVFRKYCNGEITFEEAGLHNIYDCKLKKCPQCEARDYFAWYWTGVINDWLEDSYGWLEAM